MNKEVFIIAIYYLNSLTKLKKVVIGYWLHVTILTLTRTFHVVFLASLCHFPQYTLDICILLRFSQFSQLHVLQTVLAYNFLIFYAILMEHGLKFAS